MDREELLNQLLVMTFNEIMDAENRELITGAFKEISINDVHIIEAVGIAEPRNMSTVAKKMSVTVGTLTTAINNLVKKGYVSRIRSAEDKRVVLLSLTEKGMNMSITECGGEFTVDGNGVCTQQKISMGMTLGVGTENVDMQLYMEMNVNAAGSNVVVTIPSTDGYVDMDTYLSQLMEQAA